MRSINGDGLPSRYTTSTTQLYTAYPYTATNQHERNTILLADQFLKKSIFVRLIFEWIYFRAYKFGNILRRFIFVDSEIVFV